MLRDVVVVVIVTTSAAIIFIQPKLNSEHKLS